MSEGEGPGGYVRLYVALDQPASDGVPGEEWLWAEPLGSGRYRLDSSPFFAYGLSHGDRVRASEEPGVSRFSDVERKSGHRTLRLALSADWEVDRPEVQALLDGFLALGCSFEALPPELVALDLPPEVDEVPVLERLQAQVEAGVLVWEWADPRPS